MKIIFISGSPSVVSRSQILLNYAWKWLGNKNIEAQWVGVRDFDPAALVHADFKHPDIARFNAKIASAQGIIISSPVYKAACPGGLKALLDLLPERALENKVVMPLMSGGSDNHLLALDYAFKPILGVLKAEEIIHGVYACDRQISYGNEQSGPVIDALIIERLEHNLASFHAALGRRPKIAIARRETADNLA